MSEVTVKVWGIVSALPESCGRGRLTYAALQWPITGCGRVLPM